MQSKATTVKQYLSELPEDRRAAISAVRDVILKNLDKGFEEGMQYGMIGYYVPHSIYPAGYHCDPKQPLPFASLASQKNHMSVYLMSVYFEGDGEDRFRREWAKSGKKLDMGKSCVRFKKLEDAALDVIGAAIRRISVGRYVEMYETLLKSPRPTSASQKPATASKATAKKAAVKKNRKAADTAAAKKKAAKKKSKS